MSLLVRRSLIQWISISNTRSKYWNRHHTRIPGTKKALMKDIFGKTYDRTRLYPETIKKWRRRHGLPENPNAYGELTDLPDYSFLSGEKAPPLQGQIRRAIKQRELAEKIIQLTNEVDYAVTKDEMVKTQQQAEKEDILRQKLKPKTKLFEDPESEELKSSSGPSSRS